MASSSPALAMALSGEDRIVFDQDLSYVEDESAKHRRKGSGMSETEWLDPGEKLIWSGRPSPGWFAFQKGLAWALFSVVWLSQIVYHWLRGNQWFFEELAALFGVLALGFLLVPVWLYWRATRTIYLLTTQKVVIETSPPFARRRTVPLASIRDVESERRAGHIGHVFFKRNKLTLDRDGFIAIDGIDHVERLLQTAIEDASLRHPTTA